MRRGRNSIETDIGEEDNASSAQNTEDSAVGVRDALGRSVSRRWRNHWRVVCRINEMPADPNKEQHDAHFQNNDNTVHQSRFFRAPNKQEGKHEQNEHCRDVHEAVNASRIMFERRMRPLIRHSHIEPAENAVGVLAPCCGNRGRGDGVFENEIPANDPRDKFTHRCVGVSIGATCNRNHRCEFRITETGKCAADARDNE